MQYTYNDLVHMYNRLYDQNQDLQRQHHALQERYDALERQRNTFREQFRAKEQEWNRLLEESGQVDEEVKRLRDENNSFREILDILNRDVQLCRSCKEKVVWAVAQRTSTTPTSFRRVPAPKTNAEKMASVLNRWWSQPDRNREGLKALIQGESLRAHFYSIEDISGSLQTAGWAGPYRFILSEKDGGWLWCESGEQGPLVFPADPDFFNTPGTRAVLQRIILGCEHVDAKPKFVEAREPCTLAREPDNTDAYKVLHKGVVRVEGHPDPGFGKEARPSDSAVLESSASPSSLSDSVSARQAGSAFDEMARKIADLIQAVRADTEATQQARRKAEADVQALKQEISALRKAVLQNPIPFPSAEREEPARLATVGEPDQTFESPQAEPQPATPSWWNARALAETWGEEDASSRYPERLYRLLAKLAEVFPQVEFRISHLARDQGDSFSVHQGRVENGGSLVCEKCEGAVGAAQFFATAQLLDNGQVLFILPPGLLQATSYPRGYALLLDPSPGPSRPFEIEAITQPGVLGTDGSVARRLTWVGPSP